MTKKRYTLYMAQCAENDGSIWTNSKNAWEKFILKHNAKKHAVFSGKDINGYKTKTIKSGR